MNAAALSVDLNCDCGEGFGAYTMGDDAAMLDIVTSASVACGFHAGDPQIMAATFKAARAKGVAIGAHPGYPDLWGFGRRAQQFSLGEIERLTAYQIGAAQGARGLCPAAASSYVKVHGALSHLATSDPAVAQAIARAVKSVELASAFSPSPGTHLETAARAEGLERRARNLRRSGLYGRRAARPANRAGGGAARYRGDRRSRVAMVKAGAVIAQSGKRIEVGVDSIACMAITRTPSPWRGRSASA